MLEAAFYSGAHRQPECVVHRHPVNLSPITHSMNIDIGGITALIAPGFFWVEE
jgi:hypothetical protein